jgi:hypothetical protein
LRLKQRLEFFQAQSRLFDDRPERAGLQVAARMDWNGEGSRRVAGKDHNMMTADDPIRPEARSRQGSNDATTVQRGQPSVGHVQAATVTLRISGIASGGIVRP